MPSAHAPSSDRKLGVGAGCVMPQIFTRGASATCGRDPVGRAARVAAGCGVGAQPAGVFGSSDRVRPLPSVAVTVLCS